MCSSDLSWLQPGDEWSWLSDSLVMEWSWLSDSLVTEWSWLSLGQLEFQDREVELGKRRKLYSVYDVHEEIGR